MYPAEKKSFKELYEGLHPRLLNFIKSRVNSKEDAEDISGEVFERVLKKIDDFQWQGISMEAWVYRIAKNAIIDYYRKGNKFKDSIDLENVQDRLSSEDFDVLTNILSDDEQKKLYLSISHLDETDQYIIYYKYFEELPLGEIAKRLELSETNVGTRLHRIRKKIAGDLAESQ